MQGPSSLVLPATRLTRPEYAWECVGIPVNEGPAVIRHQGRIYLTYSASSTGPEYCLGLLTAREQDNLLAADSWQKSPDPVFATSEENRKFGPGHNGFTYAEDDATLLLVYHARDYQSIDGDPLDNPDRHTCVQPVHFNEQGELVLGVPERKNR